MRIWNTDERAMSDGRGCGKAARGSGKDGKRRCLGAPLRRIAACLLVCAAVLAGCTAGKTGSEKVRDLEFTVIGEADAPQQLQEILAQKKTQPFKLTYTDEESLYIVVGYGSQPTGGYSIVVEELYLTDNSIVADTELRGPEKGETAAQEISYPFIIIKTEYLEDPVVFQ